jgi:hypothetical protein
MSHVTVNEAADAMLTLRAFLTQLAAKAVEHAESPSIVGGAHFSISIAGLQGDSKPYGGHDLQVWVHMDTWAGHAMHADPLKLASKAVAMASVVEELRSLHQRAENAKAA